MPTVFTITLRMGGLVRLGEVDPVVHPRSVGMLVVVVRLEEVEAPWILFLVL